MAHRHFSQRVVVPVMFVATVFMVIVDGAITTVALPAIARQFQLAPARLDAVVVVYPVCVGVAVPASAWLGDRFGGKRLMLVSMALFSASSALCGAAGNLGTLVAFRALQGLAGGLLMPVAGALLYRTFSARERVRASRVLIFPQQIAPAVAPILGGVLVDGLSWRWVFYVNLPLGLAAVLFGLFFLDPHRPEQHGRGRRFDLPGLLLSAGGLAAMTYGICAGSDHGWTSPGIVLTLAAGAVLLTATVLVELRTADPILRLRLFHDRLFRDCSLISLVGLVPILGAMFLGPLFIQDALGGSAMDSGTSTFTEAFGVLLTVQVAGALYARIGPRAIIGGGLLGVAAVLVLLSTCDLQTSLWTFRLYMFLLGVAMGAVFMPTTVASMSTISKADMAQASTLNTVVRQTAGALAPAVVTTLLVMGGTGTVGSGGAGPSVATYQDAYLVLAAIAVVSALYAFTLRDGAARQAATSGIPEPAEPAPVG
ncbi:MULTISPECIES: DHA2 family efflux MFS transporter permease subunit [Streptacidiphilus]|uniref:DHA2 family efflux MFS transporter permease subunit n=1 Tax=Streptacidiphilus cavernicola TaxID=3342716 RepID=A0ABV6UFI1_9ACTN|nr:DHA2 family efflux MFS transporter permease subunit [Streptacidiphilus jeojiense]